MGIFLSPTRGLVEYDALADTFQAVEKEDSRIRKADIFPEPQIHTIFGDVYLLLKFLEKSGLLGALWGVFPKNDDYGRILCHILHEVLKDGSKITCDNFIMKSFASYLFGDVPFPSLKSDTGFYTMMGNDTARMAFFQTFVAMMQKK